jgi:hypothetical protein
LGGGPTLIIIFGEVTVFPLLEVHVNPITVVAVNAFVGFVPETAPPVDHGPVAVQPTTLEAFQVTLARVPYGIVTVPGALTPFAEKVFMIGCTTLTVAWPATGLPTLSLQVMVNILLPSGILAEDHVPGFALPLTPLKDRLRGVLLGVQLPAATFVEFHLIVTLVPESTVPEGVAVTPTAGTLVRIVAQVSLAEVQAMVPPVKLSLGL